MQSPSSCGRKVTEAVIWRKMDWISSWISFSVFSGAGGSAAAFLVRGLALAGDVVAWAGTHSIAAFSPASMDLDFFFFDLLKI